MKTNFLWFCVAIFCLCGNLFAQPGSDFNFNLTILHPDGNPNNYPPNYDTLHPFLMNNESEGGPHLFANLRYLNSWGGVAVDAPSYIYLGYGDDYPRSSYTRGYNHLSNYLQLQGPGNTNPGNYWISQSPQDSMSQTMRNYIATQFKYILFDQGSYAEVNSSHVTTEVIGNKYHDEAKKLMNTISSKGSNSIVFPYFSITLARTYSPYFPWTNSSIVNSNKLIGKNGETFDYDSDGTYFSLMDIRKQSYMKGCVDSIVAIVNRYGYKGVFLDNMTEYPFVDFIWSTWNNLPDTITNTSVWKNQLKHFVDSLKTKLPLGTVILCNNLGIDVASVPKMYGNSHGVDFINSSQVNGGLFEAFQISAFSNNRDTIPKIMQRVISSGKVFIGCASYMYGDAATNQIFLLGKSDGSFYNVEGGTQDDYVAAWNPNFYRKQHSFLARFLLGVQGTDPSKFAFTFQPGFWRYQFIPFYNIWNANFGTPSQTDYNTSYYSNCPELGSQPNPANGDSLWNANGYLYLRSFSNCKVLVNVNKSIYGIDLPVVVKLEFDGYSYNLHNQNNNTAGGPYIYGKYYGTRGSSKYLVLNQNEGVVLFKGSREQSQKVNVNQIITEYALQQSYPNPFNPSTIINYQIPNDDFVSLKVFDALGREITTLVKEYQVAGKYSTVFDGKNLSSGIYFYSITAGSFSDVKKMLLMK